MTSEQKPKDGASVEDSELSEEELEQISGGIVMPVDNQAVKVPITTVAISPTLKLPSTQFPIPGAIKPTVK